MIRARLRDEAIALALAWQFLTRVPLPFAVPFSAARLASSVRYFPAVGAAIGAVGALVLLAAAGLLPPTPAVLLSIAATAALTGGFHEDGLADTFDGVGGGSDAARVLAIMRDSRIGTYGALALGLVVAIKAATLAALPLGVAAVALVAGHAASRLSAVAVIATSHYVRAAGTGGLTADRLDGRALATAMAIGFVALAAAMPVTGGGALVSGIAGLGAGHLMARSVFERRLGGYTGDCLGATQQLSELGFYLGVLAWL